MAVTQTWFELVYYLCTSVYHLVPLIVVSSLWWNFSLQVSHDNSEKIKYSDGMSTRQLQQALTSPAPKNKKQKKNHTHTREINNDLWCFLIRNVIGFLADRQTSQSQNSDFLGSFSVQTASRTTNSWDTAVTAGTPQSNASIGWLLQQSLQHQGMGGTNCCRDGWCRMCCSFEFV